MKIDWRQRFAELLPAYGHRNWILIADAAYPAQVGAVEVLATGEDHLSIVREVMETLRAAAHVRPMVRLDAELEYVSDDLVPGAEALRLALLGDLGDLGPEWMWHADLIDQVGEVSRKFPVLVIKTTGTVPYSSVFVELDCGYWSPAQEAELRRRMETT
jgi:hypothetical protein